MGTVGVLVWGDQGRTIFWSAERGRERESFSLFDPQLVDLTRTREASLRLAVDEGLRLSHAVVSRRTA